MFWRKDYLVGSEKVDSETYTNALFDILGDTITSPTGAKFTKRHIEASMPDSLVNIPVLAMQDKWVYKYEKSTQWFSWKEEVGDCDSQTIMFASDMIMAAIRNGWKYGLGAVDLWYISKSLRGKRRSQWAGYHSAPAILYRDVDTDKFKLRVRQPQTRTYKGAWQDASEEVLNWVSAVGVS